MGLKETAEELKVQIAEAEKLEEVVKEDEVVEEKPPVEEPVVEEKPEEKPVEEVEAKKTPSDYAKERKAKVKESERLREELDAAHRTIAELAKRNAPAEAKSEAAQDPEPSKSDDPTSWLEWDNRRTRQEASEAKAVAQKAIDKQAKDDGERARLETRRQAEEQLFGYEDQVRAKNSDYDEAKKFYATALAFSIKNLNPNITDNALRGAVANQILVRASQLLNDGYENPVEALLHEVREMGFKPAPKEEAKEEKKPDLARVAANRARNAGTVSGAGSAGRGEVTRQVAATMTSQEWARLPVAERERLMRAG